MDDEATDIEIIEDMLDDVLPCTLLDLTFEAREEDGGVTVVEFEGPDVPMLLARHGELLLALEHLATQALDLLPDEHDLVNFDADGFKQQRVNALRREADAAIAEVKASGKAYHFHPMSSRERRMLHMELAESGFRTASEGEPPRRHLVLYPGR